jgi:hypothetical protein
MEKRGVGGYTTKYDEHKLTSTASSDSMLSMSFGPKLVDLKSSVGMIKFLFIIPTVNRNVLT